MKLIDRSGDQILDQEVRDYYLELLRKMSVSKFVFAENDPLESSGVNVTIAEDEIEDVEVSEGLMFKKLNFTMYQVKDSCFRIDKMKGLVNGQFFKFHNVSSIRCMFIFHNRSNEGLMVNFSKFTMYQVKDSCSYICSRFTIHQMKV